MWEIFARDVSVVVIFGLCVTMEWYFYPVAVVMVVIS